MVCSNLNWSKIFSCWNFGHPGPDNYNSWSHCWHLRRHKKLSSRKRLYGVNRQYGLILLTLKQLIWIRCNGESRSNHLPYHGPMVDVRIVEEAPIVGTGGLLGAHLVSSVRRLDVLPKFLVHPMLNEFTAKKRKWVISWYCRWRCGDSKANKFQKCQAMGLKCISNGEEWSIQLVDSQTPATTPAADTKISWDASLHGLHASLL